MVYFHGGAYIMGGQNYLKYFLSTFPPSDSAHALFVRATYLVCHRLISSSSRTLLSGISTCKGRSMMLAT